MSIKIDQLASQLDAFEKHVQSPTLKADNFQEIELVANELRKLKEEEANPEITKRIDTLLSQTERISLAFWNAVEKNESVFRKPERLETKSFIPKAQEESSASLAAACTQLLIKHDAAPYNWGPWCSFSLCGGKAERVSGYEDARRQWKLFLNPKREHLTLVLERLILFVKKNNFPIQAKHLRADASRGRMRSNALSDPCEPKIIIYFTEKTAAQAKEKLRQFILEFQKEFTSAEIEKFGCPQGEKELWVEKEAGGGVWIKKFIPQYGPSFTTMYNQLFFYSQGGYTESQRDALVQHSFHEKLMKARFYSDNYSLCVGEKDPFEKVEAVSASVAAAASSPLAATIPPKPTQGFFGTWLHDKFLTLDTAGKEKFFDEFLKPNLTHDTNGILFSAVKAYIDHKLQTDPTFLMKLRCIVSGDEAEALLTSFPVDSWLLRYSTNAKQWVISLKMKDEEFDHFEAGSSKEEVLGQLEKLHLKNCVSPLFNHKQISHNQLQVSCITVMEKAELTNYFTSLSIDSLTQILAELALDTPDMNQIFPPTHWAMPKEEQFLQDAIERMTSWTLRKKKLQNDTPLLRGALGRIQAIKVLIQKKLLLSRAVRFQEIAKVQLQKTEVKPEEVAAAWGKNSVHYRSIQIQEAYEKIGEFDFKKIGDLLKVSADEVKSFLIQSEKTLWLQGMLDELGGEYSSELSFIGFSGEKLYPYLMNLLQFIKEFEANIHLFAKPFTLLKLDNFRKNCMHHAALPKEEVAILVSHITSLIEQSIKPMTLQQKGSLIRLLQSSKAPKELSLQVHSCLYSMARTVNRANQYTPGAGFHASELVKSIVKGAEETYPILDKLIADPRCYGELKFQLPLHMREFLDASTVQAEQFPLLKEKLQNILTRQKHRLEMIEQGYEFRLPTYFHGTKDLDLANAIMSSTIRPSQGTSWYAAFISTYPGMLRYGGVILGLPEDFAFQAEVAKVRESLRPKDDSPPPLVMPDKRGDYSLGVLHNREVEKWIGLGDHGYINQKVKELKGKFLDTLLYALSLSYIKLVGEKSNPEAEKEFYAFAAELTAQLEQRKFTFSFVQDPKRPQEGCFVAQAELGPSRAYTDFGIDGLLEVLKGITRNPKVSAFVTSNINGICEEFLKMSKQLEPQAPFTHAKGFEVASSRRLPLSCHIITLDTEKPLQDFFQNNSLWTRAGRTGQHKIYSQKDLIRNIDQMLGIEERESFSLSSSRSLSLDGAASHQNGNRNRIQERDFYIKTHLVPLMEQLIEFDYMTKPSGVKMLSSWVA